MKQMILQLRKTYLEKKFFRNSPYKYYNFWKIEDPAEVWFSRFIEFHQLNPLKKNLNFISIFGSKFTHRLIPTPKIFFSGEDLDSSTFPKLKSYKKVLNKANLSVGFDVRKEKNNFYLPLWFLSFIDPECSLESITAKFEEINDIKFRNDGRTKFACQISRHDLNGIREKMILLLNSIEHVDRGGIFMSNTDALKVTFGDKKNEFLKDYRFNICAENSNTPGYVTEKIFDAIQAGCIPVYWSEKNLSEINIFNKDAILFYDEACPQKLYNQIVNLQNSEDTYLEFISRPIFNDNAPHLILEHLGKLKNRLTEVINL